MAQMRAIGSYSGLPVDHPDCLQDIMIAIPELRPRDVLVRVEAVSVNPADVKRRQSLSGSTEPTVLGYDVAGTVEGVGTEVSLLAVGDEVWYAGDISRQGANADFHAVDERLVACKPKTLSFVEAAAMPLTTITAWETLFERFALDSAATGELLVVGGAGGVGSVLIQLAKQLTAVRVIATAGRQKSREWVTSLGADAVVGHQDLQAEIQAVTPRGVDYIFSAHSAGNVDAYAAIARPFGHITAIDDPEGLDLYPLKDKSIAWHWEFMFTRALHDADMTAQHRLLSRAAGLVDEGKLRTTLTDSIIDFSAAGLREAHRRVESGSTIGKIVVGR